MFGPPLICSVSHVSSLSVYAASDKPRPAVLILKKKKKKRQRRQRDLRGRGRPPPRALEWPEPCRAGGALGGVPQVLSEAPEDLGLPARDGGSNSLLFQLLRSPDASATFVVSSKKNMNLPILFQVAADLPKVLKFFVIEKNPTAALGAHGM